MTDSDLESDSEESDDYTSDHSDAESNSSRSRPCRNTLIVSTSLRGAQRYNDRLLHGHTHEIRAQECEEFHSVTTLPKILTTSWDTWAVPEMILEGKQGKTPRQSPTVQATRRGTCQRYGCK